MPDRIRELENLFREFPGIGPRQARRFAYFLMDQPKIFADFLLRTIRETRSAVRSCGSCRRIFFTKRENSAECEICLDKSRDSSLLMVLPRDIDFETVEKSGAYRGYYFVLGGTVPILDKEPHSKIRGKELLAEIKKRGKNNLLKEIIISMNLNPEGEHTEETVRYLIKSLAEELGIKISTLGRGFSTGTELEYSDSDTLKNALKNRG